jgi:hypothetical protein
VAFASLMVLSALAYTFWPTSKGQTQTGALLQPVPVATSEPTMGQSLDKPAGSFFPIRKEKTGLLVGNFSINDKFLTGYQIEIDGQMTEYETPIKAPGILLSAGAHNIAFYSGKKSYGPVWVEIERDKTMVKDFAFIVTPEHPLVVDETKKPTGDDPDLPGTNQGHLIVNTFPLIDLAVEIDGKYSGDRTPVTAPGILLSAGKHKLLFTGSEGQTYGPYTIDVVADETTRRSFTIKVADTSKTEEELSPGVKKIGNKTIPFDLDSNTIANPFGPSVAKASTRGSLFVNSFPLIDLEVIIDGVNTGMKTPVSGSGISLSAGKHTVHFLQSGTGNKFGPYTVEVVAGETTRTRITVK